MPDDLSDEMYAGFFGLTRRPFTLVPDPGFMFWSTQHRRAFTVLEFGLMSRAPITLVTGEIGTGKTTLVQALLRQASEEVSIGLVSNAQGERGELLQWSLHALGVAFDPGEGYVGTFRRMEQHLLAEYAAGRRVVLIFDEAQNLGTAALEELRMLTNINSNRDVLVQLVLVGQPELRDHVRAPEMRQLAQRVAAAFHLQGLDAESAAQFIAHRLRMAGGSGDEITPHAAARIHAATDGVPRLINQLCDFSMLYAWSAEVRQVTPDIVQSVLDDGVFFSGGLCVKGAGE